MRRRNLLAATAALSLPAMTGARAQAAATMRLSHQYPPSHHNARVSAAFAEDVRPDETPGGLAAPGSAAEAPSRWAIR